MSSTTSCSSTMRTTTRSGAISHWILCSARIYLVIKARIPYSCCRVFSNPHSSMRSPSTDPNLTLHHRIILNLNNSDSRFGRCIKFPKITNMRKKTNQTPQKSANKEKMKKNNQVKKRLTRKSKRRLITWTMRIC